MTAQKGSAFLLKISDGADPAAYQTVAGLRTTQMSIQGESARSNPSRHSYRSGSSRQVPG